MARKAIEVPPYPGELRRPPPTSTVEIYAMRIIFAMLLQRVA